MKFSKVFALVISACLASFAAIAQGEESALVSANEAPAFSGYVNLKLCNAFLSNGKLVYDSPVLQSCVGIKFAGFDFNVWNDSSLDDAYGTCSASETDYELTYGHSFGDIDVSGGVAMWAYPGGDWDDDWVAKTSIAYNGLYVTPEVRARFGLEGQQGCYGQFVLSKNFQLDDKFTASVYGLVGYASKSWRKRRGVDEDGFVDFECGVTGTYSVTESLSVCGGCTYSSIIDGDLRDAEFSCDGENDHVLVFIGCDLGF